MAFVRTYPPAVPAAGRAVLLPVRSDGEVIVARRGGSSALLRSDEAPAHLLPPDDALFLGDLDGVPCLAYPAPEHADDDQVEGGLRATGLRTLYGHLSDDEYGLCGYASQLLRWRRTSRFCPACGQPTGPGEGWSRTCSACGYNFYPPVSPAVLILVHDGGDRILLAQKPGWGARFSILAGFVEPGESLEECVRRETVEEVAVTVGELRYFGSQPWPFPHQLMVSFFAAYGSGEITPDPTELSEARWFEVDALPELPPSLSLSRQTIDAWIASRRPGG